MKFILNTQKGSTINHPTVGALQGGVAIKVEDEIADQLKHIINVIVFESCVDVNGEELK